jgi:phosphatidate phosphatase APP1
MVTKIHTKTQLTAILNFVFLDHNNNYGWNDYEVSIIVIPSQLKESYIPYKGNLGIISDIDDTLSVLHS